MLHHNAYVIHHWPHLILSHGRFIISHHHKKKDEYSTIIHFERETTFTLLLLRYIVIISLFYCYCCSSLTVSNLQTKLHHRYVFIGKKKQYIQGIVLSVVSGVHWGSRNISPTDKRGLLYSKLWCLEVKKKVIKLKKY